MLPKHIAIIMDGNGRWAKKRMLPRYLGHRQGVQSLKKTVRFCSDIGIKVLTVYAFSTENWKRPSEEVSFLMKLMEQTFSKEINELIENDVKINLIGDETSVPSSQQKIWEAAQKRTENNKGLNLNVAFNYGGRHEIAHATRKIVAEVIDGNLSIDEITPDIFAQFLYTKAFADPDLIIRTGGEIRTSNFLLWQSAYSEWYFTETLWPDFTTAELEKALADYRQRERRFGNIK